MTAHEWIEGKALELIRKYGAEGALNIAQQTAADAFFDGEDPDSWEDVAERLQEMIDDYDEQVEHEDDPSLEENDHLHLGHYEVGGAQ